MIIYNYNPSTGEYIGTGEAKESPREPGEFLIPANAVTAVPPTAGINEVACWNGGEWEKKADYRGLIYWDKTTQERREITEIGISPDVNWTDVEPADHEAQWNGIEWTIPWTILKERKIAEIAAARYERETAGVVLNGVTVRTDRESQALITGAALKAMQDPDYSCKWKAQNGFIELSAAEIIAIADAVRAHVQAAFDREADLAPLVEAAETQAELDAITYDNV